MQKEIKLNISDLESKLKILKELLVVAVLISTLISSCRVSRVVTKNNADIVKLTSFVTEQEKETTVDNGE